MTMRNAPLTRIAVANDRTAVAVARKVAVDDPENGAEQPEKGRRCPENGCRQPESGCGRAGNGCVQWESGGCRPQGGRGQPENGCDRPQGGGRRPRRGRGYGKDTPGRFTYKTSRKLPAMTTFHTLIRDVPDFPKPGVVFKDIGPLLADPAGFAACIQALVEPWRGTPVDAVCGVESRGFIFGAAMALAMQTGFVPLRKVGKLPPPTLGVDYDLEYGSARLEIGAEGIARGARVLLVDDVLATGGTFDAARRLLDQVGASVIGASVVLEIDALRGRGRWPEAIPLHALLHC